MFFGIEECINHGGNKAGLKPKKYRLFQGLKSGIFLPMQLVNKVRERKKN